MNTDIRLLITFKGHRKRIKLKKLIGDSATDCLIDLWLTAALDRPDGILVDWDYDDIAIAANWEGDTKQFVDALVTCKWLEINDDGVYTLHDWQEHQGWASGAKQRSHTAKLAAQARWKKTTKEADAMQGQSEGITVAKPEKADEKSPLIPLNNPTWLQLLQGFKSFEIINGWVEDIEDEFSDLDLEACAKNFIAYWSDRKRTIKSMKVTWKNGLINNRKWGKFIKRGESYNGEW